MTGLWILACLVCLVVGFIAGFLAFAACAISRENRE